MLTSSTYIYIFYLPLHEKLSQSFFKYTQVLWNILLIKNGINKDMSLCIVWEEGKRERRCLESCVRPLVKAQTRGATTYQTISNY